ncbi:TIGR02452 family protein [Luteolibacter soli]|uniref:TIGR02452 family protein n=1 Tax=Luteolibacter soli TaxID=3135280 RepID=A0ABU9AXA4_9BACT
MSLKGKAQEVLAILEKGGFTNAAGEWVEIRKEIEEAVSGTCLYRPGDAGRLTAAAAGGEAGAAARPVIEVTAETTQIAAARLWREGVEQLVLLNFASARNPGGGFINGAKAQEEDLARCSALYACLHPQVEYYERNRSQDSMLYTDHILYSPRVPWFRTRSRDEPGEVFLASVITAPAPNAGQALLRGDTLEEIEEALVRRAGMVLGVARDQGHRELLLGAWGCGVFRNDPGMVAGAFKRWLDGPVFAGAFDRVVFAVYDPTEDQGIYRAFQEVLGR